MTHNFGHYEASLYHFLGSMTKKMAEGLKQDDRNAFISAKRKHELKPGGKKVNRMKKRTNHIIPGPSNFDDAYAAGEEDLNPIFDDPNGSGDDSD